MAFILGSAHVLVQDDSSVNISVGEASLRAVIADTQEERTRGLSSRPSLSQEEGMLFVFEDEGKHSFWMKDMRFPLDILWIDKEKRVVEITLNVSPDSYPGRLIPSVPVLYVLEVNAGWTERNGIRIGDKMKF